MSDRRARRVWGLRSAGLRWGLAIVAIAGASAGEPPVENGIAGRAQVYRFLPQDSVDRVGTAAHLQSVLAGGWGDFEVQRTLEHAEKIECLECLPKVATLLWAPNPQIRRRAASWLRHRREGVYGVPGVQQDVIRRLSDSEATEAHRAYAAEALGVLRGPAAAESLERALRRDVSAVVRRTAVEALATLGPEGSSGAFVDALDDPDDSVRSATLRVALRIPQFNISEQVLAKLVDPSPIVRRRAAEYLRYRGPGTGIPTLLDMISPLNETDAQTRQAAILAIAALGTREERGALESALSDPDSAVRDAAEVALRQIR